MDATTTRQQNFIVIYKEFRENYQKQHPEQPNRGLLKLFAEKMQMSQAHLSHIKCGRKQIGSSVARQIEEFSGKPHGWLDQTHDESTPEGGDEKIMLEQILMLYRNSPGHVKRLIADAMKEALDRRPKVKQQ